MCRINERLRMNHGDPVLSHSPLTLKSLRMSSADFKNPRSLLDPHNDLGQLRHEPLTQKLVAGVADAQPDNHWSRARVLCPSGEIVILRNENRSSVERVIPDVCVLRVSQPDIANRLSLMPRLAQPASERRRQLRINQEFHRLTIRTG